MFTSGFGACQEAYTPYPNALLTLRFINEIGKIIIADILLLMDHNIPGIPNEPSAARYKLDSEVTRSLPW